MSADDVSRLTQRLDHMVPDNNIHASVNAQAAENLGALSAVLADALPDPSLSPDERLERLARVKQDRVPRTEYLLPAIEKLDRLERRLAELVPGEGLSAMDRLQTLIRTLEGDGSVVERLEKMGDPRAGVAPVR